MYSRALYLFPAWYSVSIIGHVKSCSNIVEVQLFQFEKLILSLYIVTEFSFFQFNPVAQRTFTGSTQDLLTHVDQCEHFGNEIICPLQ